MLKLIGIVVAALPVILFVNAILPGSKRRAEALSAFRKQLDFAVWVILIMIGCGAVFAVGQLVWEFATAPR